MKTPTHFIINYVLAKRLGWSRKDRLAFCIGGVAPDFPVILVFILVMGFEYLFGFGNAQYALTLFQQKYENDSILIVAHNFLHAPLSIAMLLLISLLNSKRKGNSLFLFFLGCALHSFIDIYTHVNDGPLMLWPFDWETRFASPVSHWDSNQYGYLCLLFEVLLILLFIACQAWKKIRRIRKYDRDPTLAYIEDKMDA